MTTGGALINNADLFVVSVSAGTLNVSGGSVTRATGYIGYNTHSVGTATVSSGTWATSGDLWVGYTYNDVDFPEDNQNGTGTLTMTGGLVTVSGVLNRGTLGTINLNAGGTLQIGTGGAGSGISVGNLTNNGTLAFNQSDNYTYSDAISGSGAVTKAGAGSITAGSGTVSLTNRGIGTLTLTGSNGYTGTTLLSGGTLQIGNGGTNGSLSGNVVNNATLAFNRSSAVTYSGTISGTGGLTKAGTGTFTLSGNNTYTGATAVNGGTLLVNGQLGNTAVSVNAAGLLGGSGTILGGVAVSGTLSPGNSPGILTVASLALLAGSHTAMEITGTSASLYDQVVGTGSGGLTYGGSLNLVMSGSYADQTVFNLFSNFSSYTGNFTSVGLDATGEYSGLTFSDEGGVWTSTETANNQRLVFSTTTGNLSVMTVAVPEPSTCAMALAGLACGGWRMMRRRRLRQAGALAA